MKKITLLLLIHTLIVSFSIAQTFEGSIEWKMKMDNTDPIEKARLAEAEKEMNSPENQKQIEELKKQMEDPKMKAAFESNPQMKAQMEKLLAMSNGGFKIENLMPSKMLLKIKGKKSLVTIPGIGNKTVLNLENDESYTIDNVSKTYTKNPLSPKKPTAEKKYTVTKTSETAKILDYNCTKYKVEYQENKKNVVQYIWATTEFKNFDWSALKHSYKGNSEYMLQIEGTPLKMTLQEGTVTVELEIVKIQKETFEDKLFKIPTDYKLIEF